MKKLRIALVVLVLAGAMIALSGCFIFFGNTGSIRIVNNYPDTLWRLYISADNSSTWGVDRLGSDTLTYGEEATFTDFSEGYYDVWCDYFSTTDYYTTVYVTAGETTTITLVPSADMQGKAVAP